MVNSSEVTDSTDYFSVKFLLHIAWIILFATSACTSEHSSVDERVDEQHEKRISVTVDTSFFVDGVAVRLLLNDISSEKDLILLPGWNFPNQHWEDSTPVFSLASQGNYNLVMIEMGKSIYHGQVYPVTRNDWRGEKTLTWLSDTLIPFIQGEYAILTRERTVGVLGISTGARGGVALAFHNPELIDHVFALSGDYSTLHFPDDNLYRGYLGNKEQNAAIWEQEDLSRNIPAGCPEITLVHGKQDPIVSPEHSVYLKEILDKKGVKNSLSLYPTGKHNYALWSHVIDSLFSAN